jgi:hypothetical protein
MVALIVVAAVLVAVGIAAFKFFSNPDNYR